MDAATRVALAGIVFTVVLPVGAAVVVLAIGRRLRPADDSPSLTALALLAGLGAAQIGIGGQPALTLASADGWLLYGPLIGGLAGLALDRGFRALDRGAARRDLAVGLVAAAVLALIIARLTGALAALWTDGAAPALATGWIIDAGVLGVGVWIAVDHAARGSDRPAPVVVGPTLLGPIALALAAAALATGLSGSARMAQANGAVAAVIGVVGLAGWRWPALRPGHGAVAVAMTALVAGLVHAHHFVELPRAVAGLLLIAPLGAVVGAQVGKRAGIAWAVVVSLVVAGAAVGLTVANEQAKAASAAEGDSGDGTYYPY